MKPIRMGTVAAWFAVLLFLAGCAGEIGVVRVGADGRTEYGNAVTSKGISQNTNNLLGNFLLEEAYEKRPFELIGALEKLFREEPRPEYLTSLADCALNIGLRESDQDVAVRFFLSSALYSYSYLALLDQPDLKPYNAERLAMMRTYNLAISELFDYLNKRGLELKSAFSLNAAGGQRITFLPPRFELPLPSGEFAEFLLCADYRTKNLTHMSRSFGIGAPLICRLTKEAIEAAGTRRTRFAEQQTLPGTLMIDFDKRDKAVSAQLVFLDPRSDETAQVRNYKLPLEMDFSTPLAYMVRNPLPFDYLTYMLRPGKTRKMQGLYMFEPYRSDRIPVVFVHGLMSNVRTWMQMINTLESDPVLRKYYQFWGFTYSSGNPVLFSALDLRNSLLDEEKKLVDSGQSTKMFSRMVIVGHSMGGLVAKAMVLNPGQDLIRPICGDKTDEILAQLTPDERKTVLDAFCFKPLPFAKRVVYMATPHRGSGYAQSWIGRLGSNLIELPVGLVTRGDGIIKTLMNNGILLPNDSKLATGIDNLDPNNQTLRVLNEVPYAPGVVYHSIIGNQREGGVPGGSDGIVPYLSSHLDGAASELVVKSGHSVQLNPLAIQELRRILLEHLQQFPDLKVNMPKLPDLVSKQNELSVAK